MDAPALMLLGTAVVLIGVAVLLALAVTADHEAEERKRIEHNTWGRRRDDR